MNTKYFPIVAGLAALVLIVALLIVVIGRGAQQSAVGIENHVAAPGVQQSPPSLDTKNNSTKQTVSLPDTVKGIVEIK